MRGFFSDLFCDADLARLFPPALPFRAFYASKVSNPKSDLARYFVVPDNFFNFAMLSARKAMKISESDFRVVLD